MEKVLDETFCLTTNPWLKLVFKKGSQKQVVVVQTPSGRSSHSNILRSSVNISLKNKQKNYEMCLSHVSLSFCQYTTSATCSIPLADWSHREARTVAAEPLLSDRSTDYPHYWLALSWLHPIAKNHLLPEGLVCECVCECVCVCVCWFVFVWVYMMGAVTAHSITGRWGGE